MRNLSIISVLTASIVAALGILGFPATGRPGAFFAVLLLLIATMSALRSTRLSWRGVLLATAVGVPPAVIMLGATVDLLPTMPGPRALRVLLFSLLVGTALSLGRSVAVRVLRPRVGFDILGRGLSVLVVTGVIAGALVRLLLPSRGPDLRLAWMLGEEDNAAFVGVAREVLVHGSNGAHLAEELGAAFMNLPLAMINLFGGPIAGEADVRLQAITLTLASAAIAITLAGMAMALLAALPHHVHLQADGTPISIRPAVVIAGSVGSGAVALAGFALLAVMPLQAGFLTFLWGLSLVLVAAAVVAILPPKASVSARAVTLLHLIATGVLLLGSWPFIATALAPLMLVALLWIDRARLAAWRAAHLAAARTAGVLLVLGATLSVWFVASLPQVSKVIELGRDALTVTGSSIHADAWTVRAAVLMTLLATASILHRRPPRPGHLLALLGPILGAGALMLAIDVATNRFAGGMMGYAGLKLLFGLVTLSLILGGLALISSSARHSVLVSLLALALVLSPHALSETSTRYQSWWSTTERIGSLHAIAVIEAINATSPEVPIRCLPSPGTRIDGTTRWAAYFCIRWTEQGFNEGRFDGNAFRLLNAEGETFDEVVTTIVKEQQWEYLFAYRMTMERGWFGWTG